MMTKSNAGLGRREFLQVSSTVAAGAVVLGPEVLASALVAAPKRLAIGYADWPYGRADARQVIQVMPASSIPYGSDGRFLRHDVRVAVVSSGQPSADPKSRRAVELTANFEYREGRERRVAPFHAWTFDRTTGDAGNQIRFNVPLDEQQAIRLSVSTEVAPRTSRRRGTGGGTAASAQPLPFVLSLRNEPGSYRLVQGYYIVVPLAEGEREPAWSSYAIRFADGRWHLHRGDEQASIEHLVLQVSYAG